jgi:hypothetical protein
MDGETYWCCGAELAIASGRLEKLYISRRLPYWMNSRKWCSHDSHSLLLVGKMAIAHIPIIKELQFRKALKSHRVSCKFPLPWDD